jgi:hypothetical protein
MHFVLLKLRLPVEMEKKVFLFSTKEGTAAAVAVQATTTRTSPLLLQAPLAPRNEPLESPLHTVGLLCVHMLPEICAAAATGSSRCSMLPPPRH